jgi:hypothetical protein
VDARKKHTSTALADLETTGLPLDQISLVDICDAKEGINGAPGKSRQPVQLRFQKIKELPARGYRKLLIKHNITLGTATLAAADQREQAQELPEQETTQDADEDTTQDADEELVLSDNEEEELVLISINILILTLLLIPKRARTRITSRLQSRAEHRVSISTVRRQ